MDDTSKKKSDLFSEVRKRAKKAGKPPGTLTYTGDKSTLKPVITIVTYDQNTCEVSTVEHLEEDIAQLKTGVTWVNIEGLHDVNLINTVAKQFNLHPLTIEDILNVEQRPKVEEFSNYLYITIKVLNPQAEAFTFSTKQISLILGSNFVLTFQELDTTLFDSIRESLEKKSNQRLRKKGSDYLVYRLIDAVIDEYFIVLEMLGDKIEDIEDRIVSSPTPQNARTIYRLKRQMLLLRKAIWPMREAINHLVHIEEKLITNFTRVYLRDVYDHTVQAIDTLETFRDILSSMLDMYLSSLTNRMNEIMKTLTIIATIFIPITALASIYGMNFYNLPGINWQWGYQITMGGMVLIVILMLIYFRRNKWL